MSTSAARFLEMQKIKIHILIFSLAAFYLLISIISLIITSFFGCFPGVESGIPGFFFLYTDSIKTFMPILLVIGLSTLVFGFLYRTNKKHAGIIQLFLGICLFLWWLGWMIQVKILLNAIFTEISLEDFPIAITKFMSILYIFAILGSFVVLILPQVFLGIAIRKQS